MSEVYIVQKQLYHNSIKKIGNINYDMGCYKAKNCGVFLYDLLYR